MRFIKLSFTFILMLFFLMVSLLITLFVFNVKKKRYALSKNTSFFSNCLVSLLNIRVLLSEKDQFNHEEIKLIVSNHLSWLDIIIISSMKPCFFITSNEVKNNHFLGPFAQLAGSIFVDRKKHSQIKSEINYLSDTYNDYYPICLFPEATSSNGEKVLTFKNAMFESLMNSNVPVLSMVINYLSINYESVNAKNRDKIFWYGDMGFIESLIRVCSCKEITVNLKAISIHQSMDFNTRKELSLHLYQQINAEFLPVV